MSFFITLTLYQNSPIFARNFIYIKIKTPSHAVASVGVVSPFGPRVLAPSPRQWVVRNTLPTILTLLCERLSQEALSNPAIWVVPYMLLRLWLPPHGQTHTASRMF